MSALLSFETQNRPNTTRPSRRGLPAQQSNIHFFTMHVCMLRRQPQQAIPMHGPRQNPPFPLASDPNKQLPCSPSLLQTPTTCIRPGALLPTPLARSLCSHTPVRTPALAPSSPRLHHALANSTPVSNPRAPAWKQALEPHHRQQVLRPCNLTCC